MERYGYVRVSAKDQNPERQLLAMQEQKIREKNIYLDQILTGVFIADLVLQILAYVAETERSFIKQRQAEGIAAAKLKGVHFGCTKAELPEGFELNCRMWHEGKISLRKAAEALQMNHITFYRRCLEWKKAAAQR